MPFVLCRSRELVALDEQKCDEEDKLEIYSISVQKARWVARGERDEWRPNVARPTVEHR